MPKGIEKLNYQQIVETGSRNPKITELCRKINNHIFEQKITAIFTKHYTYPNISQNQLEHLKRLFKEQGFGFPYQLFTQIIKPINQRLIYYGNQKIK